LLLRDTCIIDYISVHREEKQRISYIYIQRKRKRERKR